MITLKQKLLIVVVLIGLSIGGGLLAVWDSSRPTVAQRVAALGPKAEGQEVTLFGAVIAEYGWNSDVVPAGLPVTAGQCGEDSGISCE